MSRQIADDSKQILNVFAPQILVCIVQIGTNLLDLFWIGHLGADALAGAALVFPFFALMQALSVGGIGTGITTVVAQYKAVGAPTPSAFHAALLASFICALLFGCMMFLFGPTIYFAISTGTHSELARGFSASLFGLAITFWLFNCCTSILKGLGDVFYPAKILTVCGMLHLALSPLLVFGLGEFKGYGLNGIAYSLSAYHLIGSAVLIARLRSLEPNLFGMGQNFNPIINDLSAILKYCSFPFIDVFLVQGRFLVTTAVIGGYGVSTLAAYGACVRIEQALMTLVFGFGQAMLILAPGRLENGRHLDLKRLVWIAIFISGLVTLLVSVPLMIFVDSWSFLLSDQPDVANEISSYIHITAPFYLFLGLGVPAYYACVALGKALAGFTINLARMVLVGGASILYIICCYGSITNYYFLIALIGAGSSIILVFYLAKHLDHLSKGFLYACNK